MYCLLPSIQKVHVVANEFQHVSRVNSLPSDCVHSCALSVFGYANDFPHVSHLKGLTPVCILLCTLRFPESVNDFPNVSHVNGFNTCMYHFMCVEMSRMCE